MHFGFHVCLTTSIKFELNWNLCIIGLILEQGMVSILSRQGVEELQYLIFVLAFFHVLSCVLTFSLGMAKVTFLCFLSPSLLVCSFTC